MITKFSGSDFGIGYPYITKLNKYAVQNSHFNIGIKGAFLFGRVYPSGLILSCEPGLFIESVHTTTFKYENFDEVKNKLLYRSTISDKHQIANLLLPITVDIKMGNSISIGGSFVFSMPIGGAGYYRHEQKSLHYKFDYYETHTYESHYSPDAELGLGFSSRILFSVSHSDSRQQFIGITYYHELTPEYPAGINRKSFTISFLTRNLVTREVRQKWDRYLLRHQ